MIATYTKAARATQLRSVSVRRSAGRLDLSFGKDGGVS